MVTASITRLHACSRPTLQSHMLQFKIEAVETVKYTIFILKFMKLVLNSVLIWPVLCIETAHFRIKTHLTDAYSIT